MGNWRRVHIVGGMLAEEVDALVKELDQRPKYGMVIVGRKDNFDEDQVKKFGPLSITGGLCEFGSWPAPSINAVGNLAERDYDPDDVARHLGQLALVAPSLGVVVHCGGDYEADECVASVVLLEGVVAIHPPGIPEVKDLVPMQMENNLLRALLRPYNRTL
jgi:hypothetical protein